MRKSLTGARMIYKCCTCLWLSLMKHCFAFIQPGCLSLSFPRCCDYILVSGISFLLKTPTVRVRLEHFISPMRAVHDKHGVMECGGKKTSLKNFKWDEKTYFFWSSFPVCWQELKALCPANKMESSLIKRRRKKAREMPQASGRSKCLAKRWSYCCSLWDFQNPSEKKNRYIDDIVVMLVSSQESDIWRSFNFKWGREACPGLPFHCWSGNNITSN